MLVMALCRAIIDYFRYSASSDVFIYPADYGTLYNYYYVVIMVVFCMVMLVVECGYIK